MVRQQRCSQPGTVQATDQAHIDTCTAATSHSNEVTAPYALCTNSDRASLTLLCPPRRIRKILRHSRGYRTHHQELAMTGRARLASSPMTHTPALVRTVMVVPEFVHHLDNTTSANDGWIELSLADGFLSVYSTLCRTVQKSLVPLRAPTILPGRRTDVAELL